MMPAKAKSKTPTMASTAELGFAAWSAPEVAWTIEYPLEVMDEIRAYACDELMQLSHGGADVAGVMFGSQRTGAIRILTWRPIASEYSEGETLRLSHRDRMSLAVQLEVARTNPELRDLRPVGWFVSHPNGAVAMTSSDLEVHAGFFPESAQVTLVIHPTEGGFAEAGFFVREADGSLHPDASSQDFMLEPLRALPAQSPLAQAPPAQALPAQAPPAAVNVAEPASQEIAASESRAPGLAAARPSPPHPDVPIFVTDEPLPARERWLWAIPIALALGLAAWSLYHRQKPAEVAPMAFHVSSNAARTVQLEWSPKSPAVRDSDHGEIEITDDGKTSQISLSRNQLHSGRLAYLRQSGDVEFQLTVYPASGAQVHETTRLIAPASSQAASGAAAQAPQLLAPAAPAAGDDALQRQVRQLTEELRQERARAAELQNLVRILENRLGIKPAEPQP
jgi:hypothetical protein